MTRMLLATTNPHKLLEIRELLSGAPVRLEALDALPPIPEPDETGETFEENARLKALFYATAPAVQQARPSFDLVVAEDSGLAVDALGGEPGVRSARFLRPDATYPERFAEIFRRLAERPGAGRTARFVCAVAVARDGRIVHETRGTVEGEIADAPRGTAGFGYDPIFYFPPYGCTLAEVGTPGKLSVAHRGHAFRAVADWLHASARLEGRNDEVSREK